MKFITHFFFSFFIFGTMASLSTSSLSTDFGSWDQDEIQEAIKASLSVSNIMKKETKRAVKETKKTKKTKQCKLDSTCPICQDNPSDEESVSRCPGCLVAMCKTCLQSLLLSPCKDKCPVCMHEWDLIDMMLSVGLEPNSAIGGTGQSLFRQRVLSPGIGLSRFFVSNDDIFGASGAGAGTGAGTGSEHRLFQATRRIQSGRRRLSTYRRSTVLTSSSRPCTRRKRTRDEAI